MKKLLTLAIGFAFTLPFVASAASFVVTPSSGSYTTGDLVTLNIAVNPSGSTVYTAMLDAQFSAGTFEIVSFSLNDSMLPLKQPGYDALNNNTGVLTKTGGYAGGISSVTLFGTLVLRAKGSDTGTFTVNDSSKLLDSNNTDQQSGSQTMSFIITAKPPTVSKPTIVPPVTTQEETIQPKTDTVLAPDTQVIDNDETVTADRSDVPATSTQLATIAESGATNNVIFWIIGIIAALGVLGLGYFVGTRRSHPPISK